MTLLAASVWPSNLGWKAIVMHSLLPVSYMSSFQNREVNTGSLSKNMD